MKSQFFTLLFSVMFLFQCMGAAVIDRTSISINKRDTHLMEQSTTAIIENKKRSDHDIINKRCGGHDDVECLVDSVVDLLTSILGGGGGRGHYDGKVLDVVQTLVKAVRQLLYVSNSRYHYSNGLDGLLGSLLGGGGNNHFDDDDDFGCGCSDGGVDALIDHLIHTIQDLLDQLVGCKDGLIPQLVDAVADLLENLRHRNGNHHNDDNDHHGGHQDYKNHHHHEAHCDDGILGLDCLLDSVTELVDSLINGHKHRHSHGGDHHDDQVSGLVTQVVRLLHHLLDGLDLKGDLVLHLGGDNDDNDDDFGCGCDGDHEALISHLVKSLEHVLDQLAGCDDDENGFIEQLIKTVRQILNTLDSTRKHNDDDDDDIRQRFDARRGRKQHNRHGEKGGLDLSLIEGTLDTIEELLNRLVGECDESLLGQVKDVVDRILEGIKNILACLRKGLLNDLLRLVRALVNDVSELLTRCDGHDSLEHILDKIVHTVKLLISGCGFLGLIDLHRLVLHI